MNLLLCLFLSLFFWKFTEFLLFSYQSALFQYYIILRTSPHFFFKFLIRMDFLFDKNRFEKYLIWYSMVFQRLKTESRFNTHFSAIAHTI